MPRWTENQARIYNDHIRRHQTKDVFIALFERIEALESQINQNNLGSEVVKTTQKAPKKTKKTLDNSEESN